MRARASVSGGRSSNAENLDAQQAPQIDALGHRPFTLQDRERFSQWLQDPVWPHGSMNIYSLEGYLVALLVLPLGLRTGVWMPSIWSESGWKIPLGLQVRAQYDDYLELLLGFMRYLDAGFLATPARFESVLALPDNRRKTSATLCQQDWVEGFGLAINHCAHINLLSDAPALAALRSIAAHATSGSRSNRTHVNAYASIRQAVLVLARGRVSRGPLSDVHAVVKGK